MKCLPNCNPRRSNRLMNASDREPTRKGSASPSGVLLLLAAVLLVVAQVLPRDRYSVEPFFESWKLYWPDFDHILNCSSRYNHIQDLLMQIGFLVYWLLVLAMPWLVGWLRHLAPLLWSVRLLASGVAGYLVWEHIAEEEIGLAVSLICGAIGLMMWVAVKFWKPSNAALVMLGVIGGVQILGILVLNPPEGDWFTTSSALVIVAILETVGLFLTKRVKRVMMSDQ
jgi:hypothetical protein